MKKCNTICDAAVIVLKEYKRPCEIDEILEFINKNNLYQFGARNPKNVLYVELLRRCCNVEISKPYKEKYFRKEGNKFTLI